MKTALLTSPRCDAHQTGGHVESVQRRLAIMEHLAAVGLLAGRPLDEAAPATDADLRRVHDADYINAVGEAARRGGAHLDYDTMITPGSDDAARAAAGAAMAAVDLALGAARRAMAVVRPPGHHALAGRGMGFCLYNSVAVAAAHAQARHGLERVMVVDWDVHHGNGTQAIFEADPRVCFFSVHQWPHYPGGGLAEEVGVGAGVGATINVPVPARTGDAGFLRVLREVLVPAALRYRPELILVSAGYDAHRADPLSATRVSTDGFAAMTGLVVELAEEACGGRVAFSLEGGYNLPALAESVAATLHASDGFSPAEFEAFLPVDPTVDDRLVGGVIGRVRALHGLGDEG